MKKNSFFIKSEKKFPQIYVYSINEIYPNCLKIGYTTRKDIKERIDEQYNIEFPDKRKPYKLEYSEEAVKDDGSIFTDKDIHRFLLKKGISHRGGEWFECNVNDVRAAIIAIKKGVKNDESRINDFKARPEQEDAINKTFDYFNKIIQENPETHPEFLWNAKMRFGKTFTAYQLSKKMNWTRVLILTYKPAVENSWKEDLNSHIDFEGWQFVGKSGLSYDEIDKSKPIVCFGSFQDYLGRDDNGNIKEKNQWVHDIIWDVIILDEYHFGAWRESAKELCLDDEYIEYDFDENNINIKSRYKLYLSGTPFRAITSGKFTDEQIFNWTYSDEQRAKESWIGDNNPYKSLPQLVLLTYKMPDEIKEIALKGEFNEFDLNTFFKATGEKDKAKFIHENEVQKWLDLIRGSFKETTIDNLKLGAEKPPFPFSDVNLTKLLAHTLWFLPDIASCYAMFNLLKQPQNSYYHKFNIVIAAGVDAGVGVKAIEPVKKAMGNPLKTNTITLTCGKLTTGVTIKPWSGIFMLRNLNTPETYFQAAFRVQSPWTIVDEYGIINTLKEQCFVFDFAPNRALKQIVTYCDKLNPSTSVSPQEKVEEFIRFLPVLAYDGYAMEQVDAAGLLDIAMGKTTATLLAKGWNNALLVNVDTETLRNLIQNEEAMKVIMSIEEFRNAKEDLNIIINKAESIKKGEVNKERLSGKEKKNLEEDKRIYNSKRLEIQSKLKTLATRMPLFLYLADNRGNTLNQLIYPLEPELFKKVTGLTHNDFEVLVRMGLYNANLMNHVIGEFRQYENSSISYSGINKHIGENVGLANTSLSPKEFVEYIENK